MVFGFFRKKKFKYPVKESVNFNDIKIVLLDVPGNEIYNENVFATDKKGNILWQIGKIETVPTNSPYVGIEHSGNSIHLFNWEGTVVDIDPVTGKILNKRFRK